jgi:hypothetical protein
MTYLHTQFEPYTYIQTKVIEWKPKITLSKNHQTMTKFKLYQRNPMMYPYIKFEFAANEEVANGNGQHVQIFCSLSLLTYFYKYSYGAEFTRFTQSKVLYKRKKILL